MALMKIPVLKLINYGLFLIFLSACGASEDATDKAFKMAQKGDKQALEFLEKQAAQNNLKAIKDLSQIFLLGKGFPKNSEKGIQYVTQAANLGDKNSKLILEKIKTDGSIIKNSPQESGNQNTADKETSQNIQWAHNPIPTINPKSSGSSVAINNSGAFLTNWHVVSGCNELYIQYNKQISRAYLVAKDSNYDLAVIKVNEKTPYAIKIVEKTTPIGEKLYVGGYPLSGLLGSNIKISDGILAGYVQKDPSFMQMTASISSGSSGGPVLDPSGHLIGLSVLAITGQSLPSQVVGGSVNFAISSEAIKNFLQPINIPFSLSSNIKELDSKDIAKMLIYTSGYVACY
jgi:S1-C subfamily serine protease